MFTKEQLIEFLTENLAVSIDAHSQSDGKLTLKVGLHLQTSEENWQEISSDALTIGKITIKN